MDLKYAVKQYKVLISVVWYENVATYKRNTFSPFYRYKQKTSYSDAVKKGPTNSGRLSSVKHPPLLDESTAKGDPKKEVNISFIVVAHPTFESVKGW